MLPIEYWNTYAGGFKPLDFMRLFNSHDPVACAWAYVKERPSLYGIMRRGSWGETFAAEHQHTRIEVHAGLSAYLDETQDEWREHIEREVAAAAEAMKTETDAEAVTDGPPEDVSAEGAQDGAVQGHECDSPTSGELPPDPEPPNNDGGQ